MIHIVDRTSSTPQHSTHTVRTPPEKEEEKKNSADTPPHPTPHSTSRPLISLEDNGFGLDGPSFRLQRLCLHLHRRTAAPSPLPSRAPTADALHRDARERRDPERSR